MGQPAVGDNPELHLLVKFLSPLQDYLDVRQRVSFSRVEVERGPRRPSAVGVNSR